MFLQDLLIPLVEDKKEKEVPLLPLVGNITSILAFLLACIQCPFSGYLQDIWVRSIFFHFNPLNPNGISHAHHLDQSISVLRVVG